MKKIKVNENCSGCGICVVNCSYLRENIDGNAEFIAGASIAAKDMDAVKKVVAECPQHALEIVDIRSTNKLGAAGVKDVVSMLKKNAENFRVSRIKSNDVKLDIKKYTISVPFTQKEYKSDYSSRSSAKSAAKDEFYRLCYSENAYRPMLKKVFVEYKVNVLKPYYTCIDTEGSVYYKYNRQIREMLAAAFAEITDLLGENKIPEDWKFFSVCLSEKEWPIPILAEFDEQSTCSGIIANMKEMGKYTSLNWYVDLMDFEEEKTYVGEGMFGSSKYKTKYYFKDFYKAANEYVNDLMNSVNSMSKDIADTAVRAVNSALELFEKTIKSELFNKISELEKYMG